MVEQTKMHPYGAGYGAATKRTSQIHILGWGDVYDTVVSEKSKWQRNQMTDTCVQTNYQVYTQYVHIFA